MANTTSGVVKVIPNEIKRMIREGGSNNEIIRDYVGYQLSKSNGEGFFQLIQILRAEVENEQNQQRLQA